MSCCGQKRAAAVATMRAATETAPAYSPSAPAGHALRLARFEYRGGRSLIVIGKGTGYQYRFVGFGARLSVDPKDRASLAAVPGLREL